ncbi:MAG: M20/M25/M40 family metallo-hydrolase [Calditrichia bacterium]
MKNIRFQNLLFLIIFILLFYQGCSPEADGSFIDYIEESQIKSDLVFLCSDELQGREAGTAGGKIAASFLASQLFGSGLQPLIHNDTTNLLSGYYQKFNMVGIRPQDVDTRLTVRIKRRTFRAKSGKDYFYFFNSTQQINYTGKVVFAGYGIKAPEYKYDDLSDLPVQDRVVIVFYGEPLEKDSTHFFNGTHRTHYMLDEWKSRALGQRGAAAMIVIPTPENEENYRKFLQRKSRAQNGWQFALENSWEIPVIYLSPEFARAVFGNRFIENFQAENQRLRSWLAGSREKPFRWEQIESLPEKWSISVSYKNPQLRECQNVLGLLPGKDPELSKEYILVGSHYDHEGIRDGTIFRGADDNASGISANLAVLRALRRLREHPPRRSVVFAFWDAEEKSTLGSRYFLQNLPIPAQQIKAVFNMDMIGRDASFNFAALRQPMKDADADRKVMIFYSAQAPELYQIAKNANNEIGLHLLYDPNLFFTSGSDHMNFHMSQIPVVYYFTGFHTDYTSPEDTPEKINFNKLTRISRHIAKFVYYLTQLKRTPDFNPEILIAPEGDFKM